MRIRKLFAVDVRARVKAIVMNCMGLHRVKCFACWGGHSWENPLPDEPCHSHGELFKNAFLGCVKIQLNGILTPRPVQGPVILGDLQQVLRLYRLCRLYEVRDGFLGVWWL